VQVRCPSRRGVGRRPARHGIARVATAGCTQAAVRVVDDAVAPAAALHQTNSIPPVDAVVSLHRFVDFDKIDVIIASEYVMKA
jgi:hypothetical protein